MGGGNILYYLNKYLGPWNNNTEEGLGIVMRIVIRLPALETGSAAYYFSVTSHSLAFCQAPHFFPMVQIRKLKFQLFNLVFLILFRFVCLVQKLPSSKNWLVSLQ